MRIDQHSDPHVTTVLTPETLTKPSFVLPEGSCDSHFHVFEEGYRHVPNALYPFPQATLDQYLSSMDVLGIERMVLVAPTYYGNDNSLTLEVLRKVGSRCRAVIRIDDDTTDAELDTYHEAGARAIRLDLFARRSWSTEDLIAYIRGMAARTRPRGWHLQFYTPGTVVRNLLPFLAELEDTFVIDHMGYMLESEGLTQEDFGRLLTVLDTGYCWIKLSGPYRIAKKKPLSSVEPLGKALVQARPDRLIWGSDWPHLSFPELDTGELLNLLADWAPDEQDRRKILVDGPETLFFNA
ncbi:MAG: putative metal-dependent hydrolase, TIM-barrel fold [Amycolatopsis sp.]|jgi:predicted TIM-barrel fold metal-dependent hydrolase|uniref:amidohydrolase family protein n=1 Tax=Amycolatopsis sp. TaxID=37632 RepID=UPI002613FE47|nr:amidohydrolase family protein [Amycolatopsis sp.]MCU1686274.1 putative metal-dependent hydrolase, TIM-barrel fold [Amycolatopsis sp.]